MLADFLDWLLSAEFLPYGQSWDPWLVFANVVGDGLAWLIYTVIAVTIFRLARNTRVRPSNTQRMLPWWIGMFVLCGLTHLMSAVVIWWPVYRLATVLKLWMDAVATVGMIQYWVIVREVTSIDDITFLQTRADEYEALLNRLGSSEQTRTNEYEALLNRLGGLEQMCRERAHGG